MGLSAQNTILKTLEEPSTHAVIILIANTIDSFLPTIISRTRNLLFNGLSKKELEEITHRSLTDDLVISTNGSVERILHILNAENESEYMLLNDAIKCIKSKDKIGLLIKLSEIDFKNNDIEYLQQSLLKDGNYTGVTLIEGAKNKISQNANEDIVKTMLAIELCK